LFSLKNYLDSDDAVSDLNQAVESLKKVKLIFEKDPNDRFRKKSVQFLRECFKQSSDEGMIALSIQAEEHFRSMTECFVKLLVKEVFPVLSDTQRSNEAESFKILSLRAFLSSQNFPNLKNEGKILEHSSKILFNASHAMYAWLDTAANFAALKDEKRKEELIYNELFGCLKADDRRRALKRIGGFEQDWSLLKHALKIKHNDVEEIIAGGDGDSSHEKNSKNATIVIPKKFLTFAQETSGGSNSHASHQKHCALPMTSSSNHNKKKNKRKRARSFSNLSLTSVESSSSTATATILSAASTIPKELITFDITRKDKSSSWGVRLVKKVCDDDHSMCVVYASTTTYDDKVQEKEPHEFLEVGDLIVNMTATRGNIERTTAAADNDTSVIMSFDECVRIFQSNTAVTVTVLRNAKVT